MALLRFRNTGEEITNREEIGEFLNSLGVIFETWDPEKVPPSIKNKFVLTDEEKEQVLQAYHEEITDLAKRRGYVQWDLVALSDATPGIDELLEKFKTIHTHSEDEVRAIVGGHGAFVIKGTEKTGYFDIELEPGEVISVPENTPHFFTLLEDRQVLAVRLFINPTGWVANPYNDPEFV
jgi:1,2-dihydroxy-3-keto-5-methylthiopentene dioxygenase